MNFIIQPFLETAAFKLVPLDKNDFEDLYKVASDPKIWEQHPNKDRYQRRVFEKWFEGAMNSKGTFLIIDNFTQEIAGSTRFYDFDENENSIFIGYTFYATKYWGKGVNAEVKNLMLQYIFQYVDKVIFHVGAENFRSQKAMEKLGAIKTKEILVAYFGEPDKWNFQYEIKKEDWGKINY